MADGYGGLFIIPYSGKAGSGLDHCVDPAEAKLCGDASVGDQMRSVFVVSAFSTSYTQ